jgi:NADPH-dependent 2,4-dienoyl-CoA reductase/sulfur reductase-like enzyme
MPRCGGFESWIRMDDAGAGYTFEKLLLAKGGDPRRMRTDGILYFRTLDDYTTLRRLAADRDRFVVIGGGFIGSEITAALAMNGKQVTITFLEEGIGGRLFPPGLARFLNGDYRFDLGYETVGELDPRLEIVEDWKEPYREGVVYSLDGGRLRGVLLWNVWGQVEAARALIAEGGAHTPQTLKGRLPG